jgi:hypothetical protein
MVNKAHVDEWLHELRTTDKPQARLALADRAENGMGFCCLGIGCMVMGLEPQFEKLNERDNTYVEGTPDDFDRVAFDGEQALAPEAFGEWLGLQWSVNDPVLAIPVEYDHAGSHSQVTCARLNDDWHLSFNQIADMVAYFGFRDEA